MPRTKTYLLQLWHDSSGLWAVLKDEALGQLYQFESLEALTEFLSKLEDGPPPEPPEEARHLVPGLE
ncbi:MAG: hypothetical protein N2Z75_00995 [Meiothermus sp.]|uniref:hypothetical protein n=1 Tax=Meiothermus sp. TaxID=1955249 RepID=UPI0025E436FE|nr:hypothetical protein [Meiothermus sp.]MCS7067694.1 hypothetical protein [Meiothermus sp.]MCX7600497.1 hypothetical protein [Meiothermus sp.]MDW8424915.1 hypothetical protein [Meiothermus sp.]